MKFNVGDRILFTDGPYGSLRDGVVKELSPDCTYVKIDNIWYESKDIKVKSHLIPKSDKFNTGPNISKMWFIHG